MKTISYALACGLLLFQTSCASIGSTLCSPSAPGIYSGVKTDFWLIDDGLKHGDGALVIFPIIDVIPSLAFDTVLLLYTVPAEIRLGDKERDSCLEGILVN